MQPPTFASLRPLRNTRLFRIEKVKMSSHDSKDGHRIPHAIASVKAVALAAASRCRETV